MSGVEGQHETERLRQENARQAERIRSLEATVQTLQTQRITAERRADVTQQRAHAAEGRADAEEQRANHNYDVAAQLERDLAIARGGRAIAAVAAAGLGLFALFGGSEEA